MKARKKNGNVVRVTLCIPKDIWGYFQKQTNSPKHLGNRSSYVRSLVIEEMEELGAKK